MLNIVILIIATIGYIYSFVRMLRDYKKEIAHSDEESNSWLWCAITSIFGIVMVFAGQPLVTNHWIIFSLNSIVGWVLTNGIIMFQELDIIPFVVWKVFCTLLLWTSGLAISRFYQVLVFIGMVAYILVQYRKTLTKNQMIGAVIIAAIILAIWKVPGIFRIGMILFWGLLFVFCVACLKNSKGYAKVILIVLGAVSVWRFIASIMAMFAG